MINNNNTIFKNESATNYSAPASFFTVVNCVLNAVLMLIAVIGNSLVIAAIFRSSTLRSAPFTMLLCSLAISDLLVGLVVQPLYIVIQVTDDFFLELVWSLITYAFSGISLCTMTTISLDRFAAVHYHMRYVHMVSTIRVIGTSILIWLVMFLSLGIYLWNIILYFFIASVFTVICLLLSTLCYIRIFQIVRRHKTQIQAQHRAVKNDDNLNIMRLKKSTMNSFVFYIVLIFCNFPMFITFIFLGSKMENFAPKWSIYATFVFMNSSINPVLYCWRLRDLRSAIVKTARTMFCKQTDQLR